jgi:hypothetical protein
MRTLAIKSSTFSCAIGYQQAAFSNETIFSKCTTAMSNVASLHLPAEEHLTSSINAVDPKDRLRDIKTDCGNRLHIRLL